LTTDPRATVVDVHAHYFPADIADWAERTGDPRWPSLAVDGAAGAVGPGTGTGRIMLGDAVFRRVRAPLWDPARRLAELDAAGVGLQVISPTPVLLAYWAEPKPALEFARAVNDSLAAHVAAGGGRLDGLGTVPLQDVSLAVAELDRLVTGLGLAGAQIGTRIAGRELDDPALGPFFEAAADLGAAIFLHPLDGGGDALRRRGQPYDFGLGMLTDTAMAATALVCGGVLDRWPRLRLCLAHGCGTFPWAAPRLRLATALIPDAEQSGRFDQLVRLLWADDLVFDPEHLRLLTQRFGDGHVMVGTDYPFVPGQLEGARAFVESAAGRDIISSAQAAAILGANAHDFLAGAQRKRR
jgi:aminocarboxymuconate-semialdehyde decarboxylase